MGSALARKLGVGADDRVYLAHAPAAVRDALALPPARVAARLTGEFAHLHVFVDDADALAAAFARLKPHLAPRGRLWVSWRKGAPKGEGLRLTEIIRVGYDHGLVESKTVSVDDTWSAIKFTHPRPGVRYRNSYGRLPGQEP
ncbi:hypothetical protein [Roseisolibacter sp. H3M3-2]|uniref:hypothetical protein n=1 Tax=Roseisolibacter sp. H3M3-2 TaxID=3031323 RepID=UPI0023DA58BA|nr:hypothetical protein [Roseisolibacter sp. H3M3-2]MDF1502370.1 hypothetical protein [Roseisolibacter sp. H3M3-2]